MRAAAYGRGVVAFGLTLRVIAGDAVRAADPVAYTVRVAATGSGSLDAAIKGSSQLLSLRGRAPAGPFALVSRARLDVPRIATALESFGYYQSRVEITIAGRQLDDPSLTDLLAGLPASTLVPVRVRIATGPEFHLGHVALVGDVPQSVRPRFNLKTGDAAVAAHVLQAGAALLTALREDGYALAKVNPPYVVEIPAAQALDVTYTVAAGPRIDIGPITISGLRHVHAGFVRRLLLVHARQLYQPSKIEAARQDLASLGVFSGVVVRAAPALDKAGTLPLTFDVAERPLHAVTFTAAYSTDLGGSLGASWTDRNLFGNAERLTLSAAATGLGGTDTTGLGYNVTAQLVQPDMWRRGQQLAFDLGAIKQDLQAYDQVAETAGVALTRQISKQWTLGAGLTMEQEQILQQGITRSYTLAAVPLTAKFDTTGLANPLEDATHGWRVNLGAAPTESLGRPDATFVILQESASTYIDVSALVLARPGASVVALRALLASAQGASQFDLPPDQRFYAGGSSTVRGFRYQSVGPLFGDDSPQGGAAVDAATIEFRQRVWRNIGAAAFVDAAQVNAGNAPFAGTLREGVGAGLRYYTPIGPIRIDVAVPLHRPQGGDAFELYLGLGQAF